MCIRDSCDAKNINADLTPNSLTKEFGLYCENQHLRDYPGVMFFIVGGSMTLVLGYCADHCGRKLPLFSSIFIPGALVLIASFASTYLMFLVCFGFCGFVFPYLIIYYAHINESAGENFRVRSTILTGVCFALGPMVFILFTHFELDWRMLTRYYIAGPTLFCCLTYVWIHESPRYLFAIGKFKEYKQVLLQIANTNGIWVDELEVPGNVRFIPEFEDMEAREMVTYYDLVGFRSLRFITVLMCINCIMLNFNYYGLFFTIDKLGPDVALNTLMISLGDLVGCIVAIPLVDRLRRGASTMWSYGLAAVCGVLFALVEIPDECSAAGALCTEKGFTAAMLFLNRCFICYAEATTILHAIELYPTPIRSIGLCFCLSVGKFFGGAPAAIILDEFKLLTGLNPILCFSIASVIAIFTILPLRETKDEHLLDTIPELEVRKKEQRTMKDEANLQKCIQ
eukprot:TRINITY_DN32044_c0_g1_i2.p1 TRINITY_DN32044_c0_g1~~TRINITY_DN32044_c0_g1_i2.p1  ORF type:complete len:454 (-),score=14.14 TRINITY_DN32044_c0_g1_i2:260-1621(-)